MKLKIKNKDIELSRAQREILLEIKCENQAFEISDYDAIRLRMQGLIIYEDGDNPGFKRLTITKAGESYARWLEKPFRTWWKNNWLLIVSNIITLVVTLYHSEIWGIFIKIIGR